MYGREEMGPEDKLGRKTINILVKIFTLGKYGANSLDYLYWSTYYALRRAKKIITVSNFSKKEIIDVYGPKRDLSGLYEKIKVIHNGYNKFLYDQKIGDSEIKKVLNKYGIRGPYILYIGRLEKKKNTPALIEAFAIMKEKNKNIKHKLVLVGDASFGYDEVKYQISEFMLDEEVIMPGWVEEDDMPILYCGASVFVFPSLYEGFGIPLLQAMACGVPVATSRAASIPEVTDDAAVLFDPHNTRDIAAALEKIITDNNLRAYLKERGQAQVKNFGWEKCARETLAVLNDL
jgi:glycosyltransferase involved in cell wall biosynthesis